MKQTPHHFILSLALLLPTFFLFFFKLSTVSQTQKFSFQSSLKYCAKYREEMTKQQIVFNQFMHFVGF